MPGVVFLSPRVDRDGYRGRAGRGTSVRLPEPASEAMLRSSCPRSPAGPTVTAFDELRSDMSRADQVACEDVVMFVNAAIASTVQREFQSGSAAQRLSLAFLHEYVLGRRPL